MLDHFFQLCTVSGTRPTAAGLGDQYKSQFEGSSKSSQKIGVMKNLFMNLKIF